MLRPVFKKNYLNTIGMGISPDQIAKGTDPIIYNKKVLPGSQRSSILNISQVCEIPTSKELPKQTSTDRALTSLPVIERVGQTTTMDFDIAKSRLKNLKQLVAKFEDGYLISSLYSHSANPSKRGLELERRIFYRLFGAQSKPRELTASLIANLMSMCDPTNGKFIINGLIEYFENLSAYLNGYPKIFKNNQKLFNKYIKYGKDEVYTFIRSIADKIPRKCPEIKTENIFPVTAAIRKVFGTLPPINFN